METLPTWLEVHGEDGQCGHQLLPDPKEVVSQAGVMARLPSRVRLCTEYKLGRINLVADALSRKAEFAAMLSYPQSPLLDRIKEDLAQDPTAKT